MINLELDARTKVKNIHARGDTDLTVSERADLDYVSTMLPLRIDAAEAVIKLIGAGGRTAAGIGKS